MIALAMEKWNFHKRMALMIIVAIGADFNRIVLGFMVATAFLSMWISNTATTMMMLPVGMAVIRQMSAQATLDGECNVGYGTSILTQSLGVGADVRSWPTPLVLVALAR